MVNLKRNKNLDQLEQIFNQIYFQKVNQVNYIKNDTIFKWIELSRICSIGLHRDYFDKIFDKTVQTFKMVGNTFEDDMIDFVGFIFLIDLISNDFKIQPYRLILALFKAELANIKYATPDKKLSIFTQIDETSDEFYKSSSDILIV